MVAAGNGSHRWTLLVGVENILKKKKPRPPTFHMRESNRPKRLPGQLDAPLAMWLLLFTKPSYTPLPIVSWRCSLYNLAHI